MTSFMMMVAVQLTLRPCPPVPSFFFFRGGRERVSAVSRDASAAPMTPAPDPVSWGGGGGGGGGVRGPSRQTCARKLTPSLLFTHPQDGGQLTSILISFFLLDRAILSLGADWHCSILSPATKKGTPQYGTPTVSKRTSYSSLLHAAHTHTHTLHHGGPGQPKYYGPIRSAFKPSKLKQANAAMTPTIACRLG